jgi:hypothetical protein
VALILNQLNLAHTHTTSGKTLVQILLLRSRLALGPTLPLPSRYRRLFPRG